MKHGKIKGDNGAYAWYENDQLHKDKGPAVVDVNGNEYWYTFGSLFRMKYNQSENLNGHTMTWFRYGDHEDNVFGCPEWWVDDKVLVKDYDEVQKATGMSDGQIMYLKLKFGDVFPK